MRFRARQLAAAWCAICIATAARGDVPVTPISDAILVREMARQAMRLAADRGGLAIADAKLAPRAATQPSASDLDAAANWPQGGALTIAIARGTSAPSATITLPLALGVGDRVPYEAIAAGIVDHLDAEFADAVAKAGGHAPAALGEAAVPDGVEAMLGQVDPIHAFRAIRTLHAAVAADGESPARLGALARAYANYGEATRPLLGVQSQVCFARALIYAERLAHARPEDSASFWTRAYVRALVTLPGAAEDVATAQSLAGDAPMPAWAPIVVAIVADDANALTAAADGPSGTLAAHAAMASVEFINLDLLVIRAAELAIEKDPADLRAMLVADDSAGMSRQSGLTEANPVRVNRAFDSICDWPELPATLRGAFAAARSRSYDVASRIALRDALEREPVGGELMPWAALGDFAREASVALAQRRLDFVANTWDVDASDDLAEWWPLVKDHRVAPILATYAKRIDRDALRAIEIGDFHDSFYPLLWQSGHAKVRTADEQHAWAWQVAARRDQTIYELKAATARYASDPHDDAFRYPAWQLFAAAPNDSFALACMTRCDFSKVRDREAEMTRRAATTPMLGWALAERAVAREQPDRALALLADVVKAAPAKMVYYAIADAQRMKFDVPGEIKTLQTFIDEGEDVGLQHAATQQRIAELLMFDGDPRASLPYAKLAADCYSEWALETLAENFAQLGRYDESRGLYARIAERYGGGKWKRFVEGFVFPPLADAEAEAAVREYAKGWPTSDDAEEQRRLATLLLIDGKLDEAAAALAKNKDAERGWHAQVMHLASVQLIRGDADAARATLAKVHAFKGGDAAERCHRHAADQALAMLEGGPLLRPDGPESILRFHTSAYDRPADASLLGAVCEQRGNRELAIAWYERAVHTSGDSAGRVLAAIRLKALGVDAFPREGASATQPK